MYIYLFSCLRFWFEFYQNECDLVNKLELNAEPLRLSLNRLLHYWIYIKECYFCAVVICISNKIIFIYVKVSSLRILRLQSPRNNHSANFRRPSADFVKFRVSQQSSGAVIVYITVSSWKPNLALIHAGLKQRTDLKSGSLPAPSSSLFQHNTKWRRRNPCCSLSYYRKLGQRCRGNFCTPKASCTCLPIFPGNGKTNEYWRTGLQFVGTFIAETEHLCKDI